VALAAGKLEPSLAIPCPNPHWVMCTWPTSVSTNYRGTRGYFVASPPKAALTDDKYRMTAFWDRGSNVSEEIKSKIPSEVLVLYSVLCFLYISRVSILNLSVSGIQISPTLTLFVRRWGDILQTDTSVFSSLHWNRFPSSPAAAIYSEGILFPRDSRCCQD